MCADCSTDTFFSFFFVCQVRPAFFVLHIGSDDLTSIYGNTYTISEIKNMKYDFVMNILHFRSHSPQAHTETERGARETGQKPTHDLRFIHSSSRRRWYRHTPRTNSSKNEDWNIQKETRQIRQMSLMTFLIARTYMYASCFLHKRRL